MDANELLKKVRQVEIKTRGLSQDIFAGEYHSAFKGRGVTFSEVREYQIGDEIRDIDWNVTARTSRPFVKVYEEERELTVVLLIDVSESGNFGAVGSVKRDFISEIAATLAFSAVQNKDKVGVIFFSDKVEKFIPPKKGRHHVLLIIRELLNIQPQSHGTDVGCALRFLSGAIKKRCATFVMSDFIDNHDYTSELTICSRKHDLTALQIYDKREAALPKVGLIKLQDAETGVTKWVNTSSKKVRNAYGKWWYEHQLRVGERFLKCGVERIAIATDEDYVKALMAMFKKRVRR